MGAFSGCALAPGMHYGESAPSNGDLDTSGTFQGLRVHLRALTPRVVARLAQVNSRPLVLPAELCDHKPTPYKLGLYDVVTVAVWEHPELTLPLGEYRADLASGQMINPSGNLFYPYLGMIPVLGLTPSELRDKLVSGLSKILNNPQLDVKVTAFRSQKVFVQGAVAKPSAVAVTDLPLTLMDAINQAGGVMPSMSTTGEGGDESRVLLLRRGQSYVIDLVGNYGEGPGPSQILLQDSDVVRVASREEAKVYVLGEVDKPSALQLENGRLSLVQALADVGGLSPLSAQAKGIYVIRAQDSTDIEVYHLDARNPVALAMADRFPLRPRDVVYVDATNLARWNRVLGLLAPTLDLYYTGLETISLQKALVK
jgi:polysaccharide export outer membrane protein